MLVGLGSLSRQKCKQSRQVHIEYCSVLNDLRSLGIHKGKQSRQVHIEHNTVLNDPHVVLTIQSEMYSGDVLGDLHELTPQQMGSSSLHSMNNLVPNDLVRLTKNSCAYHAGLDTLFTCVY